MTRIAVEEKLIAAGVRNLQEFGYPAVTAENILADQVYAMFFRSMLEDNRGNGVDAEIDALIARTSTPAS